MEVLVEKVASTSLGRELARYKLDAGLPSWLIFETQLARINATLAERVAEIGRAIGCPIE